MEGQQGNLYNRKTSHLCPKPCVTEAVWGPHTHTHSVKVFIRDRSTNMENAKTQAKHQLNDQDLSNDYKDRSIQQYTFVLALLLAPNAHSSELKVGSEQGNPTFFFRDICGVPETTR